jgi:hypothetical protein
LQKSYRLLNGKATLTKAFPDLSIAAALSTNIREKGLKNFSEILAYEKFYSQSGSVLRLISLVLAMPNTYLMG